MELLASISHCVENFSAKALSTRLTSWGIQQSHAGQLPTQVCHRAFQRNRLIQQHNLHILTDGRRKVCVNDEECNHSERGLGMHTEGVEVLAPSTLTTTTGEQTERA